MKLRTLAIYISLILFLVLVYQIKIPHLLIGQYLSPSDSLTPADAIVAVSGDDDRIKHAVDLYKMGLAPKLILSGAAKDGFTSNALVMQLEASRSGVPNEAVILEEKATNTYENAMFTKEIVLAQGFKNLILVTSPYHQRRAYETFRSVFKGSVVTFQNSPSINYSKWRYDSWWTSPLTQLWAEDELGKILWANISGNYK